VEEVAFLLQVVLRHLVVPIQGIFLLEILLRVDLLLVC
jgi:hypothetical protein